MKKYVYVLFIMVTCVFAETSGKMEKKSTQEVSKQENKVPSVEEITKNAKIEAVKMLKQKLAENS